MNEDIKKLIHDNGLKLWQVAEKIPCNDGNFSRKLRKVLSKEEKDKIINIIKELKKGVVENGKN